MQTRWKIAQQHEKEWWQHRIEQFDLDFYRAYAEQFQEEIGQHYPLRPETKLLEIGSGAAGILTFVPVNFRVALEPLERFFASVPKFQRFRDKRVHYLAGTGEYLPFRRDYFDLIIIDNVIDHCANPKAVFTEMHRVLKPGGIVYLRLNTYHAFGHFVRALLELFRIDRGHPFTFSRARVQKWAYRSDLHPVTRKNRGYLASWLQHLRSRDRKQRVKALLLLTGDKTTYILRKTTRLPNAPP